MIWVQECERETSNCDKALDEPTMYRGNPNDQDPSSRDDIVASYRRNDLDLPPSTKEAIMALGYPGRKYILEKDGIVISYNPEHKGANFVCELLTPDQIEGCYLSRDNGDDFHEDLCIINSSERATKADYKDSGYTRGHLAAAANHAYNFNAYTATYCYSNIVPMYRNVNGIIGTMENEARKLAEKNEKVYIYSGPVFYSDRVPIYTKEDSKVRVPDSIFKVIVHMEKNCRNKYVRGYQVANSADSTNEDIRLWKKKLPDINSQTGLRILGDVDLSEIVDVLHPCKSSRRSRNIGR